jgi:hypothetical protein
MTLVAGDPRRPVPPGPVDVCGLMIVMYMLDDRERKLCLKRKNLSNFFPFTIQPK